jgi:hypothetical protein
MNKTPQSVIINTCTINQQNGNYLVNGNIWVNGSDMRGLLAGASLNPNTMPIALIGCRIGFNTVTLTPEDIQAAGGEVKVPLAVSRKGRNGNADRTHIAYKQPGEKRLDWTFTPSQAIIDKSLELAVTKGDSYGEARAEQRRQQPRGGQFTMENTPATPANDPQAAPQPAVPVGEEVGEDGQGGEPGM